MLARVLSAAVNGIEAYPVEVEVNSGWGDTVAVITESNFAHLFRGNMKEAKRTQNASIISLDDEIERLIAANRLRPAVAILKQALVRDFRSVAAHFHLARVYRRLGKNALAFLHAKRTLRLSPCERHARLNLGLILEELGDEKRAMNYYRQELKTNPDSAPTLWNIGRLYYQRRQWSRARKALIRCFDMGFDFEMDDTVHKLGYCCFKARDLPGYVNLYERFVAIEPRAGWAAANLGHGLLLQKKHKRALLWLNRAREIGVAKSIDTNVLAATRGMRGSGC